MGTEKTIVSRLDAMDKALVLLQTRADRVPSEVDLKVGSLERLNAETFSSIQKQFDGIATLANQASMSSKVAIDAALSAFDKATAKAEAGVDTRINQLMASTDKRFDQVDKQFNTAMGSRDVLIEAIRERTAGIETKMSAIEGRGGGYQSSWVILVGAVGAIGVIAGLFIMVNK